MSTETEPRTTDIEGIYFDGGSAHVIINQRFRYVFTDGTEKVKTESYCAPLEFPVPFNTETRKLEARYTRMLPAKEGYFTRFDEDEWEILQRELGEE